MGGQACVLYGAAEFSRDLDLALLPDPANLEQLDGALRALDATPIAVPALSLAHLQAGLAVHFRCRCEDVLGLRIERHQLIGQIGRRRPDHAHPGAVAVIRPRQG